MVGSLHVLAGEVWLSITSHQQKFFLETVFQANDPLKKTSSMLQCLMIDD